MAKKKTSQAKEVVVTDYFTKHMLGAEHGTLLEYKPLPNSNKDAISSCIVLLNMSDVVVSEPMTIFDKIVLDAIYTLFRRNEYALNFGRPEITDEEGFFSVFQILEIITGRSVRHPGKNVLFDVSDSIQKLAKIRLRVGIGDEFQRRADAESGKTRASCARKEMYLLIHKKYAGMKNVPLLPAEYLELVDTKTGDSFVTDLKITSPPVLYTYSTAIKHFEAIPSSDYLLPKTLNASRNNVFIYAYLKEFVVTAGRNSNLPKHIDYENMCAKIDLGKQYSEMTRIERKRIHETVTEIISSFSSASDSWLDSVKPYVVTKGYRGIVNGITLL